ncbi:hypothetical protein ASG99_26985 [Bacillus sp. Soil768D1]|nr:hypothetical protein ASG99_26985 [Bacillus sp. Soil768D1]
MDIKSYKDKDGNRVVIGALVEVIYQEPNVEKIGKVVAIEKIGHYVWINIEGEGNVWRRGTRHTRKYTKLALIRGGQCGKN